MDVIKRLKRLDVAGTILVSIFLYGLGRNITLSTLEEIVLTGLAVIGLYLVLSECGVFKNEAEYIEDSKRRDPYTSGNSTNGNWDL